MICRFFISRKSAVGLSGNSHPPDHVLATASPASAAANRLAAVGLDGHLVGRRRQQPGLPLGLSSEDLRRPLGREVQD